MLTLNIAIEASIALVCIYREIAFTLLHDQIEPSQYAFSVILLINAFILAYAVIRIRNIIK